MELPEPANNFKVMRGSFSKADSGINDHLLDAASLRRSNSLSKILTDFPDNVIVAGISLHRPGCPPDVHEDNGSLMTGDHPGHVCIEVQA